MIRARVRGFFAAVLNARGSELPVFFSPHQCKAFCTECNLCDLTRALGITWRGVISLKNVEETTLRLNSYSDPRILAH